MSETKITARAEALAALDGLTAREREAVRVLLACAWVDSATEALLDNDPKDTTPKVDTPHADGFGMKYARLALPPKTVTRLRPPVPDPHGVGEIMLVGRRDGSDVYDVRLVEGGIGIFITPERKAIMDDLLANPTETVEVE